MKKCMIGIVIVLIYNDDIVITSDNLAEISRLKIFFILNFFIRIWKF